jgi:predicted phosphoribosyltransferase
MKFSDRADAGRRLASKLAHLKDRQPVVLALPRGGVAVGLPRHSNHRQDLPATRAFG